MSPDPSASTPFRLGEWEVDPRLGALSAGERSLRLEPQLMDLLVYLASRPGEVVSKQEILDSVWQGRAVGDDALTGSIYQLRKALGDEARQPRYVETLSKRGYRLVAPVVRREGERVGAERVARTGTAPTSARRRAAGLAAGLALAALALLALALRFGPARRSATPPGTSAAEAEVENGRSLLDHPTRGTLLQARLYFERARQLDPASAPAAAGLAKTFLLMSDAGDGTANDDLAQAHDAAATAVALDPRLGSAHAMLGAVALFRDRDFAAAEAELQRALTLSPDDADAHRWHAFLLSVEGRHAEAVAEARRAVALDPLSLLALRDLGQVLLFARDYEGVVHEARKLLEKAPDYAEARLAIGWAYALEGREHDAYAELREAFREVGVDAASLTRLDEVYAREGMRGVYRVATARLEEQIGREAPRPDDLLLLYTAMADRDRAFELLDRAVAQGDPELVFLAVSPHADPLRADPRFDALVRRLGLPARPARPEPPARQPIP